MSESLLSRLSDEGMAYKVRMLCRSDLDHEPVCVAARDRILLLSKQRDALLGACKEQANLIEGLRNLLAFYRTGSRPSEKVLDAVQDASGVRARALAAIAKASPAGSERNTEGRNP